MVAALERTSRALSTADILLLLLPVDLPFLRCVGLAANEPPYILPPLPLRPMYFRARDRDDRLRLSPRKLPPTHTRVLHRTWEIFQRLLLLLA